MAGVYIHIPFCKKQCNYCDFYRVTLLGNRHNYIRALLQEMIIRRNYLVGEHVDTIYFGGGTPSLFTLEELAKIIHGVKENYLCSEDAEITVEVNPDDVSSCYIEGLKLLGFNRISIGIQSWRDKDLKLMNRRHDSAKAEEALKTCIEAGFTNISADLIYGLPGLSLGDWEYNLDKMLSFNIQHLSAYHLTIEQGTIIAKMVKNGNLKEIEEEDSIAQYDLLLEKTTKAGFINYEISNFGKEGYFSKHNTSYWKQIPYIGLGPSAHSYNGYSRQWNVCDINKYIEEINKGSLAFEYEELYWKTKYNEYVMTQLRTMWGVNLEYVETNFNKEIRDYVVGTAVKYIDYGMMKEQDGALVLTKQGIMISDNIIAEFMIP